MSFPKKQKLLVTPTGNLPSYFRRGLNFYRYAPSEAVPFRGNIILIHGLLMRAASMDWFSRQLAKRGYRCFSYDYPTSHLGIFRHGEILRERIKALFSQIPPEEKIYFVTHSMGGILLRIAVAVFTAEELARVNGVVMLAPPNQGSFWPQRIRRVFPFAKWISRCLMDLRHTEDSPLWTIALPKSGNFPRLHIIRGKYDAKVTPEQLPLPGVSAEIVSAPCGHAALRHSQKALKETLRFIEAKIS